MALIAKLLQAVGLIAGLLELVARAAEMLAELREVLGFGAAQA